MSGFGEDFGTQIVAVNVDATTPDSTRIVQELGFANHGLVIRSETGDVLWKQPDHEVNVDEARQAIEELLAKR